MRQQPEFSVIVPTFNRSEVLRHVLRSWARQSPAEVDFEVIVIDDGSRDRTQAVLDAHRNNRYTLRTRWQSNQGPAAARNLALGMTRGRYVLFSGDDIEKLVGGRFHVEPNPEKAANAIITHINTKRKKLGLPV